MEAVLNVSPAVNHMLVRFYLRRAVDAAVPVKFSNHRHIPLRKLAWQTWELGKDQALLECMVRGYSLCVAKPVIDEVHDRIDREYAEWNAEQDRQLIEDGHADLVSMPQTF